MSNNFENRKKENKKYTKLFESTTAMNMFTLFPIIKANNNNYKNNDNISSNVDQYKSNDKVEKQFNGEYNSNESIERVDSNFDSLERPVIDKSKVNVNPSTTKGKNIDSTIKKIEIQNIQDVNTNLKRVSNNELNGNWFFSKLKIISLKISIHIDQYIILTFLT